MFVFYPSSYLVNTMMQEYSNHLPWYALPVKSLDRIYFVSKGKWATNL